MKPFLLFILWSFALSLVLSGCRPNATDESRPWNERLGEDTESTLKALNRSCGRLAKEKQYDSIVHLYKETFQRFPARPTGQRDSVAREVGLALNALLGASRAANRADEVVVLTDSLLHTGSSFLNERCNYYLLAFYAFTRSLPYDTLGMEPGRKFLALPPCPDPYQEMLSCHLMAQVFQYGGGADTYIGLQERAVAAYRRCGTYVDAIRILSQMGYYYRRSGMYDKAVECLQEGYEQYLQKGQGKNDPAAVKLVADLSNTYFTLLLHEKALEMNAQAIGLSLAADCFALSDLYRMRSAMFEELGNRDSCLYYSDRSIAEAQRSENKEEVKMGQRSRALFFLENDGIYPDSVPAARQTLERIYADSASAVPMWQTSTRLYLGLALTKTGELKRGKAMMEQAAQEYVALQWNENIMYAYKTLMELYVKAGMKMEVANLFPAYAAMRDSIEEQDKIMASLSADVRYETGRKEEENKALATEVSLKEQALVYARLAIVLSLILLLAAIGLLLQYRRLRRREREKHQTEIGNLLSTQQELNGRAELLGKKLQEFEHNEIIDNVRQQLNPTLLSGQDEVRFRQSSQRSIPATCRSYAAGARK